MRPYRYLLIPMLSCAAVSCVNADAPVDPGATESIIFEVPQGSTISGLTPKLLELGLLPDKYRWKLFLRSRDASCLKAGRFELRGSMSMNQLLDTLCGPPLPEDEPFTVVEGWRIEDIDIALTKAGLITAGTYTTLATSKAVDLPFPVSSATLEGYLWPETYMVVRDGFTPKAFIERQLNTFKARVIDTHPEGFGDRSLHDVVVMASMLEREEPKVSQRPIVAGILWKRLDNDWRLGVDATSRYTLDDWNDRRAFLAKLRDPEDVYNTRLRMGLPPTAIGNPSIESIEASMAPESSPYWYYLHDSTGTFHGGRDGKEHEANRKKYNVY